MNSLFRKFAEIVSRATGRPVSFMIAVLSIIVWASTGPLFNYSDTWQLIINTSTTIITFLMVFLVQNTQNRDAKAIQLKLDELVKATKGARNSLIDLEDLSDEELEELRSEFQKVRERIHSKRDKSQSAP